MVNKIRKALFEKQDQEYKKFNSKLNPSLERDCFIGVRTPDLKALAKEFEKDPSIDDFLKDLPHTYFEENQLHAFIISEKKDYDECMNLLVEFLPYINNWATCDQLLPKVFKKNKDKLLPYIEEWIKSDHVYTIRFAIGMLMKHFLDENFEKKYVEMVISVKNEDYYVKMMIAWYFATALAKRYEDMYPYIKSKRLEKWTHNKAIQKSIESYRLTKEEKEELRALKIK